MMKSAAYARVRAAYAYARVRLQTLVNIRCAATEAANEESFHQHCAEFTLVCSFSDWQEIGDDKRKASSLGFDPSMTCTIIIGPGASPVAL